MCRVTLARAWSTAASKAATVRALAVRSADPEQADMAAKEQIEVLAWLVEFLSYDRWEAWGQVTVKSTYGES